MAKTPPAHLGLQRAVWCTVEDNTCNEKPQRRQFCPICDNVTHFSQPSEHYINFRSM